MIIEACVGNLLSAIKAEEKGAHQIELCDRLDLDGTSPKLKTVEIVCSNLSIPIKVIINPKPFNYSYSKEDSNKIVKYVQELNKLRVEGIVFGPLDKNNLPDIALLKHIKSYTDLPITFHKAIDQTADLIESIQLIMNESAVDFILSSGGKTTAKEGIPDLIRMKNALRGSDIELIAAGKITNLNLNEIHEDLQLTYYHGKQIVGPLDKSD